MDELVEIVGTGRGTARTRFNISTVSALVVAAAGRARCQARQPQRVEQLRSGGRAGGIGRRG